jgi:hypothetical protein
LGTQPPNFDFTKLRQNLIDNSSDSDRVRLLKGLHEKLWHELKDGMERFLRRLGVPERCYELIETVIATCEQCNAFKPVPRRPRFGAELAGHFGDVLMVDLFYIFNMQFMLMIDEAVRYKVAALLATKDAKSIMKCLLNNWIRYFGACKCIMSDQEGGIKSDDFALACDRFSIHRKLAGSDDRGQHTSTGLVERHVSLVKITALKCEHQCRAQGLDIDKEDIVIECCMGQNHQLEYNGYTPAQGLLGHNPRGIYEPGTQSVVAHSGAADTSPDFFESYMRMRLLAKVSIQQAIIELRLSEANRSAPQKVDLSKLQPLKDQVDLYRVPEKKDESGWRGPCELLDISRTDNTAIVKHQSNPYIVPLRHICPHLATALYFHAQCFHILPVEDL